MKYSRHHPSENYKQHIAYYQSMHTQGYSRNINGQDQFTSAQDSFPGDALGKFLQPIQQIIEVTGAKSVLDYGSGKGQKYHQNNIEINGEHFQDIQNYWKIDSIKLYEPALQQYNALPADKVDGVISTDVLEHIPEEDIPWVIEEMFEVSKNFVFASIACFDALAILPNGKNAHCTVKHPQWWAGIFQFICN